MRSRRKSAPLREPDLIARLRQVATHPAARGLLDDAAVLTPALGRDLVLTHDMLAECVHFLPTDPPADIAHKALAVNLSDLAAMGARPVGALLGLGLTQAQDEPWLEAFTAGLSAACATFACPLLGGDTIAGLDRLTIGVTAIGDVPPGLALSRTGAKAGDDLWVSGNIGDAGLGLRAARGEIPPDDRLLAAYRRPQPRLALGLALRGLATAAMDVSDGLLIDAKRLAEASGLGATVHLAQLPVSRAAEALAADPLALATSGDDYELLFTTPPNRAADIAAVSRACKVRLTRVGAMGEGVGLAALAPSGERLGLDRLGWEHALTG